MTKRKIDHIVYCVPDLKDAITYFTDSLGIIPYIGGKHLLKGTENALINLGNGCYLELLAIDHENKNVSTPRWMGIDFIRGPKITRWAIQSENLNEDQRILKTYNPKMGVIEEGQRKTNKGSLLKWHMTLPLSEPDVELIPFVLSWKESAHHPTDKMKTQCSLQSISFHTVDEVEHKKRCFQDLSINNKIHLSTKTKITATIEGPKGSIVL